jgi:excinuclease ABC subunit A
LADSVLEVEGASEHNLRDVDVAFGPGLTAVVGVSGSGKSSLVFDVVFHEARRRLLDALSLASPWSSESPARVRRIRGLAPAVALGQDSLIRNPNSTVATATGVHPFLRLLYSRFATRVCPVCETPIEVLSLEERLRRAQRLLAENGATVFVPLLTGVPGSHRRLLAALASRFGAAAIEVDGARWDEAALDAAAAHTIRVETATLPANAPVATIRNALDTADALGTPVIVLRTAKGERALARAPICPGCGHRLADLRPSDLRDNPEAAAYRIGGLPLAELLTLPVTEAAALLADVDLPPGAGRARAEVARRLEALAAVGLDYVTLDRSSPTLSRGEAQRMRLAVLLTSRVEGVVHVLDEPTIGLAPAQVGSLLRQLGRLRGPVLMVEHDRWAVANADDVVELGPGAGADGGRVVFRGPPVALWQAETPSGRAFPRQPQRPSRRPAEAASIAVAGATLRNLRGFDCSFPVGRLSVVTGPSGAGKTTLVRDVLVASLVAGKAVGCAGVGGAALRPVVVDQAPIGRNPRSNPATYCGLATRIRDVFAEASDLAPAAFTFNRPEGACSTCAGMGAILLEHRYLAPTWLTCDDCDGRRFRPETLEVRLDLGDGVPRSIADVYALSVDEAAAVFAADRNAARKLEALTALGLGYLELGQPSPSLSGGEAQRIKLARQLAKTGDRDLLVVDEPTTGLHPADLARLLAVLRETAERGATVIVVEHHPDVVAAADHVVRLGPAGGPDGGRLLHAGPPEPGARAPRPRTRPRAKPRTQAAIKIRRAAANNLRDVSLEIPKGALTALVGLSGSGKSSLLVDVIQAEASRRLLECLSQYERQSVKEGPEAAVRTIEGLGPTVFVDPTRPLGRRSTVGSASEISFQLAVLLAYLGERGCTGCGAPLEAAIGEASCRRCGHAATPLEPRHFLPSSYQAACLTCSGLGTVAELRQERLVTKPDRPLMNGAMYSPGFFPGSYFGKPGNGGYDMLRALALRYGFDPATTPWRDMSAAAKQAFLFGDDAPLEVEFRTPARTSVRTVSWRGLFSLVEHWDIGGLYTEHVTCRACQGGRLRAEFLAVRLAGRNRHELHTMPLVGVAAVLADVVAEAPVEAVAHALTKARRRLDFLARVGLGYLHLDRTCSTLSAGEAQRLKLSSLLGGELTGMTVLLDEPSRGLHPREVGALTDELVALTAEGNTVIVAEHDPAVLGRADHLVVVGPGAGKAGGRLVASGSPRQLAASPHAWALGAAAPAESRRRRHPSDWLQIKRPRENNLSGEDISLPLGVLAGVCGVSGSGKSTLVVDTLARALAPKRLTSSVAYEPVRPGRHDAIEGAPARTVVADQAAQGTTSPGAFLGVSGALRRAFAASDEAVAMGLTAKELVPRCDGCHGRGLVREDMGFLPTITYPCDACDGTGYRAEVRSLAVRGRALPETESLELTEVLAVWGDDAAIAGPLELAVELGLGHLVVRQPAASLSGGELQRLKLVRELAKEGVPATLFVLDEPTVGQQERDVARLIEVLDRVVGAGHSVLVVDHHPTLLAACDWLVELGPGGGPDGGRVVAAGTPDDVAHGPTATAPYLREVLA